MRHAAGGLGRRFHLLWTAAAVSMLGDGIRQTALPLLAAHLTQDPLQVSLVTAADQLPWLVFGLVAGALADRHDRLRLMWWTDAARSVLVGGLAVAVATGRAGIGVLVAFALLLGSGGALFDTASPALVPGLVPAGERWLRQASGRMYGAQMVSREMAGPALGGVLFAAGMALPYTVDAVSFALSALLLSRIGGQPRAAVDHPPLWQTIAEGWRWLARHRLLRTLTGLSAVVSAVLSAAAAVLVLLVTVDLGVSGVGFGLMMSAGAVAGLGGSALAARIAGRLGTARTVWLSFGTVACGVAGAGLAPNVWLCGAGYAVLAFAAVVLNVVTAPLRQLLVPDELRGRVISVHRMIVLGGGTAGALLGGLAAAGLGVRAPFLIGALLTAACAVAARRLITAQELTRAPLVP